MEDIDTMRVVAIDNMTKKMESVIEEIGHNGNIIRRGYIDIVNAASTILSRNADIARRMEENVSLNKELGTLQAILEREAINGCDR